MTHIFFKEPNGEWQGPFSEREVQGWYRENWFTSEFEFTFIDGDQKPDKDATRSKLSELIELNGVGCVFIPPNSDPDESTTSQNRLKELDKKIELVQAQCSDLQNLNERMEAIEKKLANLTTTTESSQPDNRPNKNHSEKYAQYADIIINVLAAMESDEPNCLGVLPELYKKLAPAAKEVATDEQKEAFLKILLDKLSKHDFAWCEMCDLLMQNPRHIVMHLAILENAHHKKNRSLKDICEVLHKILHKNVQSWLNEETEFARTLARYAHLKPDAPRVVPDPNHVFKAYQIFRKLNTAIPEGDLRAYIPLMMKNAQPFFLEFRALVGDKLTRCPTCQIVTGSFDSLCAHLTTYAHITHVDKRMPLTGWSLRDPYTFYLNFLRKDRY